MQFFQVSIIDAFLHTYLITLFFITFQRQGLNYGSVTTDPGGV